VSLGRHASSAGVAPILRLNRKIHSLDFIHGALLRLTQSHASAVGSAKDVEG